MVMHHHKQAACSTHLTGQRCGIDCAAHVAVLQNDDLPVLQRTDELISNTCRLSQYHRLQNSGSDSASAAMCCMVALQEASQQKARDQGMHDCHVEAVFAGGPFLCKLFDS